MSGLYPIIRRTRRPLVIRDDGAGAPPIPLPAVPLEEVEQPVGEANRPAARKGKRGTADKGGSAS